MRTYHKKIPPLKRHQRVVYGANSLEMIKALFELADHTPDKEYYIPYLAFLPPMNGHTMEQLAEWFAYRSFTPVNIIFEEGFGELVYQWKMKLIYDKGVSMQIHRDKSPSQPISTAEMEQRLGPVYIIQSEERAVEVLKECNALMKNAQNWSAEDTEHYKRLCMGYAIWVNQKKNQQNK